MMTKKLTMIPFDLSKESEALELIEIVKKYYSNVAYMPTLKELMEGKTKYFKAFDQDQYVGMSGYYHKTPTLVETVKTIVFERFRGQKYGEAISWAIEDVCVRAGVTKIMSTIYTTNVAMIAIKLKQGYRIEGFHPDHEAPGFDEYSLGKVLNR